MSLLARNLDPERFDVQVVVLTHSGPHEQALLDAGIPVHHIGKRGKIDPFAYLRLQRLLRRLAPDVVHTWLFAANSYGRLAARRAGVPVVIAGERSVDPWKSWWNFAIDRRLAKQTNAIVTNSTGVVDFYARQNFDRNLFRVIPNAVVDVAATRITKAEFFRRLNIEPRQKIVLAIGRLWAQKGYRDLIWASELLRAAHGDLWFVIVGDGPELGPLQKYRDDCQTQNAIRFAGHRPDAAELLTAADVLWNGSEYEGQSNTILEAMSLGVPVVASDIPGNRDLVVDESTGFLFPLGDVQMLTRKTLLLLRDTNMCAAFGENARRRVSERFGLSQMVTAHEKLYTALHARKR